MKLIYVIALAAVLLSDTAEQVEMNCPEGWIIQGQVLYYNISRTNNNNSAMCLICQLKTTNSLFGSIELCILDLAGFQNGNMYRRKQKICGHKSQSPFETNLEIDKICKKNSGLNFTCGASISESAGIDFRPENVQFLPCDNANATLPPIKKNIIDIECPKNWKLNGIKRQERTYYLKNDKKEHIERSEMCVTCNSIQLTAIYLCTTFGLWRLNNVFDVHIDSENITEIDETEQLNNFCGYKLIHETSYDYNKKQLTKCDESEKNIDSNDTAKNSNLVSRKFV
jgi:hypothetical protein